MQKLLAKKVFYGWFIVLAGLLTTGAGWGIFTNCASLFIRPVTGELGFSRQAYSLTMTIVSFCSMLSTLAVSRLLERLGMRRVLRVSALGAAASFSSYAFCSTIPQFYASSILLGAFLGCFTSVPLSLLIGNWFYERRGLAMGVTFMGSGIVGMVFNPVADRLITALGWRPAFLALGGCSLLLLVPALFFLVRERPEDMGLRPLGAGQVPPGGESPAAGLSRAQALRSPRYWALVLFAGLYATASYALMLFTAPHLADLGYSTSFAAGVVSACMGGMALGNMLLGTLYDKLGARRATLLSTGCGALGLAALALASTPAVLPLAVAGFALGCPFTSVANPVLVQKMFGRKDYGAIYGPISAASSLGIAASPLVSGAVFGATGSYQLLFAGMAALAALLAAAYLAVLSGPAAERYR